MSTVKQMSDNEIYLLIKYIKSVLWKVVKCLSYTEEARYLKVNQGSSTLYYEMQPLPLRTLFCLAVIMKTVFYGR